MLRTVAFIAGACGLAVAATCVQAQTKSEGAAPDQAPAAKADASLERIIVTAKTAPTVKEFFDNPQYGAMALSADGEHVLVTTPINGRLNLAVIELKTRKGVALTNFSEFDVFNAQWVGSSRIVFTLANLNAPTGPDTSVGGGLFMLSRDGSESRKLSPTIKELMATGARVNRGLNFVRTVPNSEDEIIAAAAERSSSSVDLYRVNVRTGARTLLTHDRPALVGSFFVDRRLVARAAISYLENSTDTAVYYRKDEKSPWEQIAKFDNTKGPAFYPVGFLGDDHATLAVATNAGRNTMAIYRYDPEAKKLGEVLAEHPRYDLGRDQMGTAIPGMVNFEDRLVGIRVEAAKQETTWIDPQFERLQKMIDSALPNAVNNFARTPKGDKLLITSFSDRQPTRWYLFDEKAKTLEELLDSIPWVKPDRLVEQRPILVKTRDGLEIPGYVFVPKDRKPGERLPTIVNIHGGPQARADLWGYRRGWGTMEGQFFASRGYVVVLPNHRITPGLGSKIFYSGFGTFGKQMIEDHEDAVKWAVDDGLADPKRVCIYGGSYGGYATLMSLAKTPDLYRCGVSALPMADVEMQLTSASTDFAHSNEAVLFWKKLIGAEGSSKSFSEVAREVSPTRLASRIKAPVFLIAGEADQRTPIEQTRAMVSALEQAGNKPRVMIKLGEGHGFGKVENRVDMYSAMLEFFDQQIGGRRAE